MFPITADTFSTSQRIGFSKSTDRLETVKSGGEEGGDSSIRLKGKSPPLFMSSRDTLWLVMLNLSPSETLNSSMSPSLTFKKRWKKLSDVLAG